MPADRSALSSARSVDVDFGATPTYQLVTAVTDTPITATMHILAVQSGEAATGRSADENEMDPIHVNAAAGTGTVTLRCTALNGPVTGKYRIVYRAV